ncbi:PAS domain-containing protein [Sphingomonas sp. Mn802worker]|uniref:PAS domain-containing protein n=1 Tax=Sphingomonas sp. Mn802worker TaxID=629773 RepID=UPI0003A7B592|nr:PAS domain-containing protein [Sphingomonas sp. Mn802worker]
MPAGHCVSSFEGIILQADRGFLDLLQRREDEVIGASYRDITDPRDLELSVRMLTMLEAGAAPVRWQKRYLRADGSSIATNLLVTRFSNPARLVSTLFWQDDGRPLPPAKLWEAALRIRHVHVARVRLFGSDMSTDPVGSLLTGIYLAEAEGRNAGLGQVADYAALAAPVAERWVRLLQQREIVEASDGMHDIRLTKTGLDRVETMLAAVYEAPDAAVLLR